MTDHRRASERDELDDIAVARLVRRLPPPATASAAEVGLADLLGAAAAPGTAQELSGSGPAAALLAGFAAAAARRGAACQGRRTRGAHSRPEPMTRSRTTAAGRARSRAVAALVAGAVALAGVAYAGAVPRQVQQLATEFGRAAPVGTSAATAPRAPVRTDRADARPAASTVRTATASRRPAAPPLTQSSAGGSSRSVPARSASTAVPVAVPSAPTTSAPATRTPTACLDYRRARTPARRLHARGLLIRAAGGRQNINAYCGYPSSPSPPKLPSSSPLQLEDGSAADTPPDVGS